MVAIGRPSLRIPDCDGGIAATPGLVAVEGRVDQYKEKARQFVPWAVWRHLKRAAGQ
jgi:hypothetical protein